MIIQKNYRFVKIFLQQSVVHLMPDLLAGQYRWRNGKGGLEKVEFICFSYSRATVADIQFAVDVFCVRSQCV